MRSFANRSLQKELIDDFNCGGEELRQTLQELKTINRLLGGNRVTTGGIKKLINNSPLGEITVADVGCGGGDMIRVMHDWAKRENLTINFVGLDANANTVQMASDNLKDLAPIRLETIDVFDPVFQQEKTDIITCTLFTHHFTDDQLVSMFQAFKKKATLGMVINDLHRHPLAFYSIKILTRLFSKSRLVINDAPISVQRSFRKKELQEILNKAGWKNYSVTWHWAFRWQVVGYR